MSNISTTESSRKSSEMKMASHSPKTSRARARLTAPAGAQNLTLPLPFEIRDQILTYLLVTTQRALELNPGLWPLYRCGSEYVRATTGGTGPHVNDLKLSKRFRILAQVSRTMRADAINVLFYRNNWHLKISLCRGEGDYGPGWAPIQFVGWDSGSMVRKLWGQEAMQSVRYLKVTIENENRNVRNRMQGLLQTFVKTLVSSRNLRRLEVEWLNYESLVGPVGIGRRRNEQKEKIREVSRKEDSTRESTKHFRNGVSRWEEGQKILKPLEALRGIPEVVVTGCVTDKWAEHLEKCMKSDRRAVPQLRKKGLKKKAKVASGAVIPEWR